MSLNNINFVKNKSGLGTPLSGKDYISGMVFYSNTLPSGFSTGSPINEFFSIQDAEDAGIKSDYSDGVQATGVYTISTTGATGDSIILNATEPEGVVVELGRFTCTPTDTTTALIAAGLVLAINANTINTGYSASTVGAVITIKVRKGLGIWPNTNTLVSAVVTGSITGSLTTPFAGGVASIQAIWHYHISEFFRAQPKGFLFVGIFPVPSGTYSFSEITNMQNFANGDLRQVGIYKTATAFSSGDTTAIQTVLNALEAQKQPLSAVLAPDISGTANITSLPDLSTLSNGKVSVVVSQDAGSLGNSLWYSTGKSISNLGNILGTIAAANVQENIAWVGKFNVSNGTELESIGFGNGQKVVNLSQGTFDSINLKRYIFLRKYPNVSGSYFNDSNTAISEASDYAYIERSRVIDKAIRGIYVNLIPSLNSPIVLNADGSMKNTTIAYLEGLAATALEQMQINSEVSAFDVVIDPRQNVASTSLIVVSVSIVPIGSARNIVVNIGFQTSI